MGTLFGVADENSVRGITSFSPVNRTTFVSPLPSWPFCICVAGPVSMWIASRLAAVAP